MAFKGLMKELIEDATKRAQALDQGLDHTTPYPLTVAATKIVERTQTTPPPFPFEPSSAKETTPEVNDPDWGSW